MVELEASRAPDARIRRIFVDPLGRHALLTIQMGSGSGGSSVLGSGSGSAGSLETYYVDGGLKKARLLGKLKGLALTSVAWSPSLRANGFG